MRLGVAVERIGGRDHAAQVGGGDELGGQVEGAGDPVVGTISVP